MTSTQCSKRHAIVAGYVDMLPPTRTDPNNNNDDKSNSIYPHPCNKFSYLHSSNSKRLKKRISGYTIAVTRMNNTTLPAVDNP